MKNGQQVSPLTVFCLAATLVLLQTGLGEESGNSGSLSIHNSRIDMGKAREIPFTQDELNEVFRYDPETGKVFWRTNLGPRTRVGSEAGCAASKGYRRLKLKGESYPAHRIIWIMEKGRISVSNQIDHINGIRNDNRIENLRLVTNQQNQFNRSAKGCSWCKQKQKWIAYITVNRKIKNLGCFETEEDARAAYLEAKGRYHNIEGPNLPLPKKKKVMGCCYSKGAGKWMAYIWLKSKTKHLGYYDTKEEAHAAHLRAREIYHETPS